MFGRDPVYAGGVIVMQGWLRGSLAGTLLSNRVLLATTPPTYVHRGVWQGPS